MSPSNRMTSRRRRKKKKKTKFSAARPGNETKKIEFHKKNKKKKKKKRREPTINDQQAKSQSPKSSTYHLPHWPQSPQSPDRNVFFLFLDFFIKKNFATHFFFVVVGGWWLRWWWCSIVCLFVFFLVDVLMAVWLFPIALKPKKTNAGVRSRYGAFVGAVAGRRSTESAAGRVQSAPFNGRQSNRTLK